MVPIYIRMHAYTYHTYVALYPYHIGCIHTPCMHVAYMDAATVCMAHTCARIWYAQHALHCNMREETVVEGESP